MKKSPLRKLRFIPWLKIIIPAVTFALGILGGPIWETVSKPLVSINNLPITIFIVMVVVLGLAITLWTNAQQKFDATEKQITFISRAIGQKAQVIPYNFGYEELEQRIKNAHREVLILSNYVFDWKNMRHGYSERINSPSRRAMYETEKDKLKTEMDSGNFKYSLVIQIPKGHTLSEILPGDPIYRSYIEDLVKYGKTNPQYASVRAADVIFSNSFVIVDRAFVYIEFSVRDPETGNYQGPFVMTIDDPNSEMVTELLRVHQRVEASAQLITKL